MRVQQSCQQAIGRCCCSVGLGEFIACALVALSFAGCSKLKVGNDGPFLLAGSVSSTPGVVSVQYADPDEHGLVLRKDTFDGGEDEAYLFTG